MSKLEKAGQKQTISRKGNNEFYKRNNENQRNYMKNSNLRIIQKQLVYVIGLSANLAFKDNTLSSQEYFGQYGKILKLVVNKNKVYNQHGPSGPSYSVHVTYSSQEESSLAILALDNSLVDNHLLRASFGTTKYCSNFLNKQDCMNKECLYLHSFAKESDILEREDMATNQAIFHDQHLLAMKLAGIFNPEKKKKILAMKGNKVIFPSPHLIYEKELIQNEIRTRENSICLSVDSAEKCSEKEEKISNQSLSENLKCQKLTKSPSSNKIRKCSRFGFASSNTSNQQGSVEIPSFIISLIRKEFLSSYLKRTRTEDELDFASIDTLIEKESNPWCEFLIENNAKFSSHMLTRKFNSS